ncbi:hypothetical protein ACP4OV_004287 [Aristida adscensionis]
MPKPHFVLIPWPATSHMIAMSDFGCLLAAHGAAVTVVTTPAGAPLIRSRVEARAGQRDGQAIAVAVIPFPAAEAGLPEGCERLDHVPSGDMVPKFFDANARFGDAVARYCGAAAAASPPRPGCVVAGTCNTWALGVARELGVPCFVFHGFGAFALLCCEYLHTHRPHEAAAAASGEAFDLPVLPPFECRVARRQLPLRFQPSAPVVGAARRREQREFELAVDGVVVNTFDELEHGSAARLAAATGKKVIAVGPVSLRRAPARLPDDDAARCVAWLDGKEAGSVLYVSFGSAGRLLPAQLMELGAALVSCPWPVLWAIKGADSLPEDVKKWLRESTDADGVADSRCLVVRGWAPQVPILDHPAVGGFLTHCGWGSTLESVAAGVPVATWPLYAEQFLNERLIVDVLGVGVSVGVAKPTETARSRGSGCEGVGEAKAEVGMEQVKGALERLMDGGDEARERRRKVRELKVKAEVAVEEGGSSYVNLEKLIQYCV